MQYRILVVVEKAPHNYAAYAPEVPGCISTGKTVQETLRNMQEALKLHLEGMVDDGDELPLSAALDDEAHFIEVEVEKSAPALGKAG